MCQFIESIRVENGVIFLLEEHQRRVNGTFQCFDKQENTIKLNKIFEKEKFEKNGIFKFRIEYDLEGNFITENSPYMRAEIKEFQLIINDNVDYSFKYKNREVLEEMKRKSEGREIIIIKNQCVTDTSFSNIVFFKNGQWFASSTYLLNGVQRQFLLKNNKIKEIEIGLDNISQFTHFKLINAMNDLENSYTYPIEKIHGLPSL